MGIIGCVLSIIGVMILNLIHIINNIDFNVLNYTLFMSSALLLYFGGMLIGKY